MSIDVHEIKDRLTYSIKTEEMKFGLLELTILETGFIEVRLKQSKTPRTLIFSFSKFYINIMKRIKNSRIKKFRAPGGKYKLVEITKGKPLIISAEDWKLFREAIKSGLLDPISESLSKKEKLDLDKMFN